MKHEIRPVKFIVAGLVIIGLLIAGNAIQNSAWTQGYTMGLLSASADSAELAPYLLYRTVQGPHMAGGLFGGILKLGFLLLLALGIFKLFGSAYRHKHGGPPAWMRHHCPPWEQEDGPSETPPVDPTDSPQSPTPVSG